MGGESFAWPAGTYVKNEKYQNIMMAMDTTLDTNGCSYKMPEGTAEEMALLDYLEGNGIQPIGSPMLDKLQKRIIEECKLRPLT